MQTVYLTRRNLVTLLNKLDRNKAAHEAVSRCTVIKKDMVHPKYPCTDVIQVTAVEDSDYYTDRLPGEVYEADLPNEYRKPSDEYRKLSDKPRYPHADEVEGNL